MTIPKHAPTLALTRRAALGLIGATSFAPQAAFAIGLERLGGEAFGTSWGLVRAPGSDGTGLKRRIASLLDKVDAAFSPWRADSAISAFNASERGSTKMDPALRHVTAAALDIAARSAGAFDPTVGPLVARWGFGPITTSGSGTPDWRGLQATPTGFSKARPDLTLDLCGIAKGWALDRLTDLLNAECVSQALVEIGGEFVAIGTHPEGRDWRVAVESPRAGLPPVTALRQPPGMAIATSGARTQSYVLDGRVYSHIIDPVTGEPASGALGSVSVVAHDAMTADGWATALFAAGEIEGPEIARREGLAALFLLAQGEGYQPLAVGSMTDFVL